jgi:hypothetical protein
MGVLKVKEAVLDKKSAIVKEVLEHFDHFDGKIDPVILHQIAAAADNAFNDEILFEEFDNWFKNRDDDSFIFLISDYWNSVKKPILPAHGDITGNEVKINEIKEASKKEIGKKFATALNELCIKNNLRTLKEIGDFLGGLSEERVRVLLEGNHKPQRNTILKVAEKFKIDPTEFTKKIVS